MANPTVEQRLRVVEQHVAVAVNERTHLDEALKRIYDELRAVREEIVEVNERLDRHSDEGKPPRPEPKPDEPVKWALPDRNTVIGVFGLLGVAASAVAAGWQGMTTGSIFPGQGQTVSCGTGTHLDAGVCVADTPPSE